MDTVIVVVVLLAIIGSAAFYVYKAKKSGKKCIGCPQGGCASKEDGCGCCGGCCPGEDNTET